MSGSNTEDIRDMGLTGQWRPSDVLKFDGMAGVSITNAGCDIACKTDTVGKRGRFRSLSCQLPLCRLDFTGINSGAYSLGKFTCLTMALGEQRGGRLALGAFHTPVGVCAGRIGCHERPT
jgi:hypothetical protein